MENLAKIIYSLGDMESLIGSVRGIVNLAPIDLVNTLQFDRVEFYGKYILFIRWYVNGDRNKELILSANHVNGLKPNFRRAVTADIFIRYTDSQNNKVVDFDSLHAAWEYIKHESKEPT